MIPKKVSVLETVKVVEPEGGTLELQKVVINQSEVYAVTWVHAGHSLYTSAVYFVCANTARQYLVLHSIIADLTKQFTPEQEKEYAAFKPRNLHEMETYLS